MRVSTKLNLRGREGLSQTGLDRLDFLGQNRSRTLRTPQAHSQTQRHDVIIAYFLYPYMFLFLREESTFLSENVRTVRRRSEKYC